MSDICHFICCPNSELNLTSLGIKAAYSAAKLQPVNQLFFSLVWWANYFYPTTAKLHPRQVDAAPVLPVHYYVVKKGGGLAARRNPHKKFC